MLNIFYYQDKQHFGTPLCFAIKNNRTDFVKLLLEAGADVNAFDNVAPRNLGIMYGETPLIIAVKQGNLSLVKLLMSYNANPAICIDPNGSCNALVLAYELGHREIFNYLVEQGARYPNGTIPTLLDPQIKKHDFSRSLNKFIIDCTNKLNGKELDFIREKILFDYLSANMNELVQTIVETGYLKSYEIEFSYKPVNPNFRQLEITREFHGAQHVTRVFLEVLMLFGFAKKLNFPAVKNFSKTDLLFTCIAALFHDIARKGEGKDEWEKQSKEACFKFLSSLGLSQSRAHYFANAITHDESNRGSKSLVSILLQSADCLDVMRARENFCADRVSLFQMMLKQCPEKYYRYCKTTMIDFVKNIRQFIAAQGDLYFPCQVSFLDPISNHNKVILAALPENYDIKIKKQYEHADNCLEAMMLQLNSDPQFKNLKELLDTEEAQFVLQCCKQNENLLLRFG